MDDGKTKWIYFLTEDHELLEKVNTIWDKKKYSADIKREFDSELVYKKSFLRTKIKFHDEEVTHFYEKKIPNS